MNPVLQNFFIPTIIALGIIAALFICRGIVIHMLRKWETGHAGHANATILQSLKMPSIFWCVAIGLYVALELSELPRKYIIIVDRTIYILIIFSVTIAIANLAVKALENYTQRSDLNIPATGIILGVFKATIIIAGFLVILNILGISIAPLLTALGVGGLAVALALKDTLSNLFAGLHIIASKQVRPGDYIKLHSGEEGLVTDITWRSTTITSGSNNIIIIPNANVASAIITNYEFPDKQLSLNFQITVPDVIDIDRLEKLTYDVAREIADNSPGAVHGFEPSVTFQAIAENGIVVSIHMKVTDFSSQNGVRHDLIKALHTRYAEEGIIRKPSTRHG